MVTAWPEYVVVTQVLSDVTVNNTLKQFQFHAC